MSILGIFENIISDFLLLLIAIIFAWVWIHLTQRKNLIDFFNVSETKKIVIYLSNIKVIRFGALGITGRKMSYEGEATAFGEVQAAYRIQKLFSFVIPALAEASKAIGTFFLSDVTVQVQVSPRETTKLDSQATIITLGSPAYNAASAYIEKNKANIVKFQPGTMSNADIDKSAYNPSPMSISSSTDTTFYNPVIPTETEPGTISYPLPSSTYSNSSFINDFFETPIPAAIIVSKLPAIKETNYGFIQRIRDDENKRSMFYIAGLSEYATKGAAYYLSNEWPKLFKKYGKNIPFLVMLTIDLLDFTKYSVVLERDLSQ